MIKKQNNEIFSTEGKFVHIIGTDNYFKRGLAIGLSVEQCEEVDEIPQTISENNLTYENRVNDLIRSRYMLSEELAILRQKDEKPDEYKAYFAFCEECKSKAKLELEQNKNTSPEKYIET